MRKLLFCLLLLTAGAVQAQTYYNEWIDFSKTYYKFKVGTNGLHRIAAPALSNAGMGAVRAEHFQLWRNGQQVPIFTSVASGLLQEEDYIEFWGEMNDGKADNPLYRNSDFQLNDKWSLQTDSATYFLTVNAGTNLRLTNTVNDVANNFIPAEAYFMHTVGEWYKSRIHAGYAVNVGEWLYSSSYDQGEGWSSTDVGTGLLREVRFNNLRYYDGGIDATINVNVSGNAINPRRYSVNINGDTVLQNNVDYFLYDKGTTDFANGNLASNNAIVQIKNHCLTPGDRMVIHKVELTYPRMFNFDNRSWFEFYLPENPVGNYLEITNFNAGTMPVLYDLTNGQRYVVQNSGGFLKVVLQPSAVRRRLVLVNTNVSVVNNITALSSRTFVNYSLPQHQGDYLIISHQALTQGVGGSNPVEEYRQYRSSALGGGYNAKVFYVDDLVDQFGYGIKMHPLAIRNFVSYTRASYPADPKQIFLIGRGVTYNVQRLNENNPDLWRMHFVPTWGNPASDVLFTAEAGQTTPKIPVGRLSVINASEISVYLKKVKDHEAAQRLSSPLISDKAWMKNVMHIVGASEPGLQGILDDYMRKYKRIIQDTLFGAKVTTFTKTSPEAVEQLNNGAVDKLFAEGITLMLYFGHSSSGTLEFNLNNPDQYNNNGKYPLFIALGCNAGDFFNLSRQRLTNKESLSEKYTLAQDRGTIGFIASSHFGIVHYLDIYNTKMYQDIAKDFYGATVGELMMHAIDQTMQFTGPEDFYARAQSEESILHGDPAIRLNPHAKPDYVVEDPMVKVSPTIISVADQTFHLQSKFMNIGKAIASQVEVEVKREYPNKTTEIIYRSLMPSINFLDSLDIDIPIDPLRDKGSNKITVTIDAGNNVSELFENNNSVTKEFFVIEDEARPIYPYNYSIVGKDDVRLVASTANPLSASKAYRMEIDTTDNFDSPLKRGTSITTIGGLLEYATPIKFQDSTVYYWRVGTEINGAVQKWNTSSFVYIPNVRGFNQSHLYQHQKSGLKGIQINQYKRWEFSTKMQQLFMRNGVFPTAAATATDFAISVNGDPIIRSVCGLPNIIVNVFDPIKFKPLFNANAGQPGQFGSDVVCGQDRAYNFQFTLTDSSKRLRLLQFLEAIPTGSYVVVKNVSGTDPNNNYFATKWKNDTSFMGSGRSLYHHLAAQGFEAVDSFDRPRAFIFTYQKNNPVSFTPKWIFSNGIYDRISLINDYPTPESGGFIQSPVFGPAKEWKEVNWNGVGNDVQTDQSSLSILGVSKAGVTDTLMSNVQLSSNRIDISTIDAGKYPFLKLFLSSTDTTIGKPYQLKRWQVSYTPAPEGAVAANLGFVAFKDSIEVGEGSSMAIIFKNVSDQPFDSLKARITLTDNNNVAHVLLQNRFKPLQPGDTLQLKANLDSKKFVGFNSVLVDFNPDNDQPEQHRFNNFLYQQLRVHGDSLNPLLDVTFDNIHILNKDIVSSRPEIVIKLKDNAKFLRLDDSSLVDVKVLYPGGMLRQFDFTGDTLRFTPAAANGDENSATINFNPHFLEDGEYELHVAAKDKSNNNSGQVIYKVAFRVINKPMISNMLNYPNPFTTSTAFVFTLTGSEVPQNIKIQILTVTGKIVREITKNELGPLRIGRNITEFKWDGTDQYGQQLGNGVYLYRVVTNLNGKSLDKYGVQDAGNDSNFQNTDKYFNKGYGKMYLMR